MLKELEYKKDKLEKLTEIWTKYGTNPKIYYNVLLPEEIPFLEEKEIIRIDEKNIKRYKQDLEYYKYVLDIYIKHDFIMTQRHLNDYFFEPEMIYKIYCSPDIIDRIKKNCEILEVEIAEFEEKEHV